jgi:hypothetical protein
VIGWRPPEATRLERLAIGAGLDPSELREYLSAEIERRIADAPSESVCAECASAAA